MGGHRLRRLASAPLSFPWAVNLTLGVMMVVIVAALDYATGHEVSFSLFYLAPVAFVTWYIGLSAGLTLAMSSAVLWGAIDTAGGATYSSGWVPVWNAIVRLGFFVSGAYMLSALHRAQERLHALATTDSLTALANSRLFYSELERELHRQERYGSAFTLAYIDLDHFKMVNDSLGHAAGDELLQGLASAVAGALRAADILARLGGDEFGILMPETDREAAAAISMRIHQEASRALRATAEMVPGVGVTVGLVVFESAPASADEAVRLADDLMYRGKQRGRDTIQMAVWDTSGLSECSASTRL